MQDDIANLSACHHTLLPIGAVLSPLAHEGGQTCLAECVDMPALH